jgi:hypothetical protein
MNIRGERLVAAIASSVSQLFGNPSELGGRTEMASPMKAARRTYSTDLERIVARTALIENMLNQVVMNYCAPRKDLHSFFWDVLLDSSVMPIGSKVKVAMAVSQKLRQKLDRNALHKVMSLRNAFAHHSIESHPVIVVKREPEKASCDTSCRSWTVKGA